MPHVSCFKLSENHISQSQRFNNSDSGCESRGHPAVRSSIFPVWFALSPPTAALARAPRLTWRRSCWACARNAGADGPRGPSTCPSRNRSPECRCQTARVSDVSWRPRDAVYSPCGRRPGPPARRASRRVQRTRRTWNTAHNAPGVLTETNDITVCVTTESKYCIQTVWIFCGSHLWCRCKLTARCWWDSWPVGSSWRWSGRVCFLFPLLQTDPSLLNTVWRSGLVSTSLWWNYSVNLNWIKQQSWDLYKTLTSKTRGCLEVIRELCVSYY